MPDPHKQLFRSHGNMGLAELLRGTTQPLVLKHNGSSAGS
uniref:Uncharacterized protein n=1 Tax=Anguilla anguilla TaxID=7936 RepID=A0A0E9Q8F4_ANGAN